MYGLPGGATSMQDTTSGEPGLAAGVAGTVEGTLRVPEGVVAGVPPGRAADVAVGVLTGVAGESGEFGEPNGGGGEDFGLG